MTLRLRPLPCTLVLAALLAPLPADAKEKSPDLWATVNACDVPNEANQIGIRASMPGNGTGQRQYMRFEAQFFSLLRNRFVPTPSSSPWIRVGVARRRSTQSGFSFSFLEPPEGQQFVLRGKVDFRWTARRKRRWVVVRTATRLTRAGVKGVEGGNPPGRSDALCVVRR
jgi:hypothetical protein